MSELDEYLKKRDDAVNAVLYVSRQMKKSPSKRNYNEYRNNHPEDNLLSIYEINKRVGRWNKAKRFARLEQYRFSK